MLWGSAVAIVFFVGWGLIAPKSLGAVMTTTLNWIIGNVSWAFILLAT